MKNLHLLIDKFKLFITFKIKREDWKKLDSGAYYREVKQCKNKLRKLFYSIVLLNLMEILDNEQLITLTSIVDKLNRLQNNHDKYHDINIDYVINVIDQLFDKILFK